VSLKMDKVVEAATLGLKKGVQPIKIDGCTGGAYYLRSPLNRIVAVFKPQDEEPYALNNPNQLDSSSERIRNGIVPGSSAVRECVAYVLDHEHFAGVPETTMVACYHPSFHYSDNQNSEYMKNGSLQEYCAHDCSTEDLGPSLFDTQQVHAIAILDIRLANQDRHAGNILVRKGSNQKNGLTMIPIDHGCCLPKFTSLDETCFEWMNWPQSKKPFTEEELSYIDSMDSWKDISMICRLFGNWIEDEAFITLHLCTLLLKKCAASGLNAFEIGSIMCRQYVDKLSMLEEIIAQCCVHFTNSFGNSKPSMGNINEFLAVFDVVLEKKLEVSAPIVSNMYDINSCSLKVRDSVPFADAVKIN